MAQRFSLKWKNFALNVLGTFKELQENDEFTDVTLSCEGKKIKCHKILLSACSNYLKETFRGHEDHHHPIIILLGIDFVDLEALIRFMYTGEVNVSEDRLETFLQTAQFLQVKGLAEANGGGETKKVNVDNDHHDNDHHDDEGDMISTGNVDQDPPDSMEISQVKEPAVVNEAEEEPETLNEDEEHHHHHEKKSGMPMSMENLDQDPASMVVASTTAMTETPSLAGPSGRKKARVTKRAKRGKGKGGNWTRRVKKKSSAFSLLSQSFNPPLDLDQIGLGDDDGDHQKPGRRSMKMESDTTPMVGDRHECIICHKTFKNKNVLYNHRSVYHRNDPQLQLGSTETVRVPIPE